MSLLKRVIRKINRILLGTKVHEIPNHPFSSENGIVITHVSAYNYGNMGDTYLPIVLRNLFNQFIPVEKWIDKSVYRVVNNKDVSNFNNSELIVIGGGGLFLKDTNPNDLSGWQWSCSIEMLNQIKSPIVAFAIGYNRFRGQDDFAHIFTKHINKFVEKASFVGLRNHGSIDNLKRYLNTQELKDKLVFQPCMTTLTSLIYPDMLNYTAKEDFIALNCAFDRQGMRKVDDKVLASIAKVASQLSKTTKIKVYAHMPSDGKICSFLDELSVPYEYVEFYNKITNMLSAYSRPRLVIGMRGHAQMIPFGCNTPILSIISHDKMQWFLDDIHHPEWGVDVLDPAFERILLAKATSLYNSTDLLMPILKKEQQYLWDVTQKNMNYIKSIILKK